MQPPSDVPASELWLKLCESPRPSEVIDFPRKDAMGRPLGKLRIQVLNMEDHDEARIRARFALKDRKLTDDDLNDLTIKEVYADRVARELLAIACTAVEPIKGSDKHGKVFPGADDIGKKLTADEINTLFTAYLMVQNKYGPYEGNIQGADELNAWIKRLAEGGSAFPLAQRSWHQLVGLTMSLAERAYLLSEVLESQFSNLPNTLQSDLASLGIGTGLFGQPLASSTQTGGETSVDEWLDLSDGEHVTVEQAAELARRLHKGGG